MVRQKRQKTDICVTLWHIYVIAVIYPLHVRREGYIGTVALRTCQRQHHSAVLTILPLPKSTV